MSIQVTRKEILSIKIDRKFIEEAIMQKIEEEENILMSTENTEFVFDTDGPIGHTLSGAWITCTQDK